uniref:Choline transporter-like protein n=1 Tax=Clastoptera arizonana TaxID=38151 RepID=A0A1B6DF63_9HEMI
MSCCDEDSSSDDNNTSVKVRGCTDVFWLIIYILFWFLMIFIAAFALVYGNPLRLVNGYDTFGNTCGSSYNDKMGNLNLSGLNTLDKKYLFFLDVKNIRNSLQICVKQCPDRNMDTISALKQFYNETGSNLCRYDFDLLNYNGTEHDLDEEITITSSLGPCPPLPVYKSIPVLNRCVPEPVKDITKQVIGNIYYVLNSWDFFEQVLSDIYSAWRYILALTFLSLVLSLAMVSLFYLFSTFVAYIILIVVSISSMFGTAALWWTYFDLKYKLDNTPEELTLIETIQNEKAFCTYAIIASIFTIIIVLLAIVMRSRVNLVTYLFREAARCLNTLPSLYFQPVLSFALLLVFYGFWITVVVSLATANYPGAKPLRPFTNDAVTSMFEQSMNKTTSIKSLGPPRNISIAAFKAFTLVEYADASWVRYMWWVYIIGLVWVSEFILACQQMVIAGAVARWYFNKDTIESKPPVWTSFRHLLSYHLGSMALGSFLITLFKVPRLILTYIYLKLKRRSENESQCAKCALSSCICCFYCLEKFIRYLNHNAYTVVAMQGINFCPAASRAWNVLASNALKLATLNSVGDFILFLGKVTVTAITGCVGLYLFKHDPQLHLYAAPTLVVCFFAFFISHSVISLYEIVIDTLFLCMCEDKNINGETGQWKQNALANLSASKVGQPPELAPINQ